MSIHFLVSRLTRTTVRLALAPVLLAAAACGYTAPTDTTPPAPTSQTNDVNIVQNASTAGSAAFNPNPQTVRLGTAASVTIRWVNRDVVASGTYGGGSTSTAHNITSDNSAFAASGSLGGNAVFSVSLSAPGSYPYHCSIHPTMVGTITVTP
jgi:plastocyanin